MTTIELLGFVLGSANFLLVSVLGLVLNHTFPREHGAALPPWRIAMIAALLVAFALFSLTLWEMTS